MTHENEPLHFDLSHETHPGVLAAFDEAHTALKDHERVFKRGFTTHDADAAGVSTRTFAVVTGDYSHWAFIRATDHKAVDLSSESLGVPTDDLISYDVPTS